MSTGIASSLRELVAVEKTKYLEERAEKGGTAEGFRQRIIRQYKKEPTKFTAHMLDALIESATKGWQKPPRKAGPDLFAFGGVVVPDTLTRPSKAYVTGEDVATEDEDNKFEKVDHRFATISDLSDDATIKMRKAAQSSAAAEKMMQAVDLARSRAKGNMATFIKDVAD